VPSLTSRRLIVCCGLAALLAGAAVTHAQGLAPRKRVTALRTVEPPVIDGRLSEEAWSRAEPASEFTQRDPNEGLPATERTEIRVLYDNDALYIAARLFDSEPDLIGRRLASRDGDRDADRVIIYLDSMYDRLTGAAFGVSASNVQEDTIIFNDVFTDSSWDAVWLSRVSVDEAGWSAEIRIPLSQLRFPLADSQTWGINVERYIQRKNETVWLERVPKTESGLASRMGDLTGLEGLRPRRRMELLPYAAARAELVAAEKANDPFNDGVRAFGALGMDLKFGLSSNLTIDATVNPDFGQVEVDPAVVNLTAFETFFPEKRAFFLEGAQIFNSFGQGGSNSFWGFNMSDPSIFYSRRIGRSPQLELETDFLDQPAATTILGAVKLTGTLDFDMPSNVYSVDPDGATGAAPAFTFDNPDFNLKSLKLNAVFRWEMKPGSTLYAVWTRQQKDERDPSHFVFGRDTRRLFGAPGDDVFLVKLAYWIGR
jgi:uncharacterized protein DUF5916/cellulose/xylan binding protein with CBM9 domain